MPEPSLRHRLVVGAMSGTSMDGLDVALTDIRGFGLDIEATLRRDRHEPFDDRLARRLRIAASPAGHDGPDLADLAAALGSMHADAIARLVGSSAPDLVCVHGQTILHRPPHSVQLIDPAPIVKRLRCPVVYDLRRADLGAGGQGAPITPMADWILFRHPSHCRAIVNLGGFCNVTILPAAGEVDPVGAVRRIRGFDVCACNQVLDAVARLALDAPYDDGGRAALRGTADPVATNELDAILAAQRLAGRSLGTGDEAGAWAAAWAGRQSGPDLAAGAVLAVSRCIGDALIDAPLDEVIIAGGGAHNAALVAGLARSLRTPVRLSDESCVPASAREALAMAVLGALCADGVAITLPQVTGCSDPAPLAGSWAMPATAATFNDRADRTGQMHMPPSQ